MYKSKTPHNKLRLELQSVIFDRLYPAEVTFWSQFIENSSKKTLPFNFQLSDNDSVFFYTKTLPALTVMFCGCYGQLSVSFATQAVGDVPKKSN